MRGVRALAARLSLAALVGAPGVGLAGVDLAPLLRLSVEERYDDAALLRTERGHGQLMTKLAPQAGLTLGSPTTELGGWYAPDLLLHHGSGSVTVDHRGALQLESRLTRHGRLTARAQVWRVSDSSSLPRVGMAHTLSPILYGTGDVAWRGALTQRLNGRVGYRFEGARIFDEGQRLGLYHAPHAEAGLEVSRRTELAVGYRFQVFTFGSDLAQGHGASALLRHRLTRHAGLTAQAGPVLFRDGRGGQTLLPRAELSLAHEGRRLGLALSIGQDVAGASGFSSALWAHYASGMVSYRPGGALHLFAAASWFRNGPVAAESLNPFGGSGPEIAMGYAAGAGAEWKFNRHVSVFATVDRWAQVGVEGHQSALARNIAGARLVITPWKWLE